MNKKQKTERCREILRKYAAGSEVTNPEDKAFLMYIFEGHTEWEQKQGSGVLSISVIETIYNNRCFLLNRTDGSSVDISFTHSICNRSKLSDIKAACRSAIRPEIVKFRDSNVVFGVSVCPISGEVLTLLNTHIDHFDITFKEMFDLWMSDKDISRIHGAVVSTNEGWYETFFTDPSVVTNFVEFHNLHCRLRAVSKQANLSNLRR